MSLSSRSPHHSPHSSPVNKASRIVYSPYPNATQEHQTLRIRYASIDIEKLGQMMIMYKVLTIAAAIFELSFELRPEEHDFQSAYEGATRIGARTVSALVLDKWTPVITITLHDARTFPINPGPMVQMETRTLIEFWLKDPKMVEEFVTQMKAAVAENKTPEQSWGDLACYVREWNAKLGGDMRVLTDNGAFDGGETSYALAQYCPSLNADIGSVFGKYRGLWDMEGDMRQLRGFSLLDHKQYRSKEDIISCLDHGQDDKLQEADTKHDHNPKHDAIHGGYLYAKLLRHNTKIKLRMLRAARCGNVEYLQRLLGKGIHVEHAREYKTDNTLLHLAAVRGHVDFVHYLLFTLDMHTDIRNAAKMTARDEMNFVSFNGNLGTTEHDEFIRELEDVIQVFRAFKEYKHPTTEK